MAARESRGGMLGLLWGWPPEIEEGADEVGVMWWDVGGPEAGDPGSLMGMGNLGCCISGPADFGVLGGVGGWPPPEGEFELPSSAEERNPGGNEPRGPNPELELGEELEAGGEESFSGKKLNLLNNFCIMLVLMRILIARCSTWDSSLATQLHPFQPFSVFFELIGFLLFFELFKSSAS